MRSIMSMCNIRGAAKEVVVAVARGARPSLNSRTGGVSRIVHSKLSKNDHSVNMTFQNNFFGVFDVGPLTLTHISVVSAGRVDATGN